MKKIIALILALCSAFCFAACGSEAATSGTAAGTTAPSADGTTSGTQAPEKPQKIDFGGHTFTFAIDLYTGTGYEVDGETKREEYIYASIEKRNSEIEKLYNCKIKAEYILSGVLTNDFATNSNTIDIVCALGGSKTGREYLDLNTLGIDFSKDWWFKSFMDDSAIDEKNYYTICYGSLSAFEYTQVILFNKTLKSSNDALKNIDFYNLVNENEWTLDKFHEIVKLAATDNDGNGIIDKDNNEIYGITLDATFAPESFYFGAGGRYSSNIRNDDGTFSFLPAINQTSVILADKINAIFSDSATSITDDISLISNMTTGKSVFAVDEIYRLSRYSSVSIGLLPFPMYKNQNYISYHENNTMSICVPKTCTDIARIGAFLDIYAKMSKEIVYPEFKKWISIRLEDEHAEQMLTHILENPASDPVQRHALAKISNNYTKGVINGENIFANNLASLNNTIVHAINGYKKTLHGQ